ncbi:rCG55309 [Rattus norvegicus]|uniref:RCG55309 n=1 Tax=Rattus norvegicus TaxID=10116 RepID=A6KF18_RAT|nr:rCG55309 [Rattus norvegicus]
MFAARPIFCVLGIKKKRN